MFTVALVGPDGAGKSTLGRRLEHLLPVPAKYIYMGISLDTSNLVLPTTRLWLEIKRAFGRRPDIVEVFPPSPAKPRSKNLVRRMALGLKSTLRFVNLVAEEWFRQAVIWFYRRRGYVVVLDRHFFFDYYANDLAAGSASRPLSRRLHGYLLRRFYPKPDFVICLDAPAEVLFGRKSEGRLEALERRRQAYVRLRDVVENFIVVDATQTEDTVARQVVDLISGFYAKRMARGRNGDGVGPRPRFTPVGGRDETQLQPSRRALEGRGTTTGVTPDSS